MLTIFFSRNAVRAPMQSEGQCRWCSCRHGSASGRPTGNAFTRRGPRPALNLSRRAPCLRPLIALHRPDHAFAVAPDPPIVDVAWPGIDDVRGGVDVLGIAGAQR